ncbi:helix-turn-helix domain-containing protein, partial [Streptomyces sp. NPDC000151]|uniref:PucR family transcriptional regulator n=1 Tax=Streptomyces sp. NPDC000151 TaxID=3154244 RepID=UPI00332E115C
SSRPRPPARSATSRCARRCWRAWPTAGAAPALTDFVDRAIGPLLAHDRTARQPLLPTLEAYLASAGRKAETSRDLNVNRQTLYDRLARISQLLGTDLDDPQTVLGLRLALHARRHTEHG